MTSAPLPGALQLLQFFCPSGVAMSDDIYNSYNFGPLNRTTVILMPIIQDVSPPQQAGLAGPGLMPLCAIGII